MIMIIQLNIESPLSSILQTFISGSYSTIDLNPIDLDSNSVYELVCVELHS